VISMYWTAGASNKFHKPCLRQTADSRYNFGMADKTAEFLPFHALNEYMRPDFRITVVRTALSALPKLPNNFRSPIDKLTRKIVHVPGFRDGTLAPASLKTAPSPTPFKKARTWSPPFWLPGLNLNPSFVPKSTTCLSHAIGIFCPRRLTAPSYPALWWSGQGRRLRYS